MKTLFATILLSTAALAEPESAPPPPPVPTPAPPAPAASAVSPKLEFTPSTMRREKAIEFRDRSAELMKRGDILKEEERVLHEEAIAKGEAARTDPDFGKRSLAHSKRVDLYESDAKKLKADVTAETEIVKAMAAAKTSPPQAQSAPSPKPVSPEEAKAITRASGVPGLPVGVVPSKGSSGLPAGMTKGK